MAAMVSAVRSDCQSSNAITQSNMFSFAQIVLSDPSAYADRGAGQQRQHQGVRGFPVREVGDVAFANLLSQDYAGVGVTAAPVADVVDAHQSDRKQLPPLLDPFGRAGSFDFSPHPFAVHAVPREHQQQAVVDLDGHGRLIRRLAETVGWTSAAPASTLATCRIACDFNIVAGPSNWGAMALAAATCVCSVIESMSWSLGRKRGSKHGSSTSWRMAPPSTASPADARQPLMGCRS